MFGGKKQQQQTSADRAYASENSRKGHYGDNTSGASRDAFQNWGITREDWLAANDYYTDDQGRVWDCDGNRVA